MFRHDAFLFPVSKILQVGLANLHRIMIFWPMVTAHLIEVSCNKHPVLRKHGVATLTRLIHAALSHPRDPPIHDSPGLQQAVLSPLRNLASCPHSETRRLQLECVMQVLDSSGQSLAHAWPVVIGIISDTVAGNTRVADAAIITLAFENLQLVVQDFLPCLPVRCMLLLLQTISHFCRQHTAVNVALTAVGLLWNVADHVSQNRVVLQEHIELRLKEDSVSADSSDTAAEPPHGVRRDVDADGLPRHVSIEGIWTAIYQHLAALCLDPRADVRRSASQTLYPTLKAHVGLLSQGMLEDVMANVVLHTLTCVVQGRSTGSGLASDGAGNDSDNNSSSSNDNNNNTSADGQQGNGTSSTSATSIDGGGASEEKRTTPGSSASMIIKHHSGSDNKLWAETKCLSVSGVSQVFVSALDLFVPTASFDTAWELLLAQIKTLLSDPDDSVALAAATALASLVKAVDARQDGAATGGVAKRATHAAFTVWTATCADLKSRKPAHRMRTLVAVITCMQPTLARLCGQLSSEEIQAACECLYAVLCLQPSDALYLTRANEVQEAVLETVLLLVPSAQHPHADAHLVPLVLQQLVRYAGLVNSPPWLLRGRNCFVGFAIGAASAFVEQLCAYPEEAAVVRSGVARSFLACMHPLVDKRYAGPSVALWEAAMKAVVTVVDFGLRGLAASAQHADDVMQRVAGPWLCVCVCVSVCVSVCVCVCVSVCLCVRDSINCILPTLFMNTHSLSTSRPLSFWLQGNCGTRLSKCWTLPCFPRMNKHSPNLRLCAPSVNTRACVCVCVRACRSLLCTCACVC